MNPSYRRYGQERGVVFAAPVISSYRLHQGATRSDRVAPVIFSADASGKGRRSHPAPSLIVLTALAALVYLVAMFTLFDQASARSPANWVGRLGSVMVIFGALLSQRRPVGGQAPEIDDRLPLSTRLLIGGGMAAIVIGFTLGTIGY